MYWWKRLPLPMALTAAAWFSLGQAEVLLRQFQQAGTQAYGVTALGGGWRFDSGDARRAVVLWNAGDADQAWGFLLAYTVVDLFLIGLIVWVVLAAGPRVAAAHPHPANVRDDFAGFHTWNERPLRSAPGRWIPHPLFWYVVFDVGEDAFRLANYRTGGDDVWLYWVAWGLEKAKFAAILLVLLALLLGIREVLYRRQAKDGVVRWRRRVPRLPNGDPDPNGLWELWHLRTRALFSLRGQVGLVAVFALLLLADATGQVGDFFRRWTDQADFSSFVFGVLSLALLTLVLWASGRRVALANNAAPAPLAPAGEGDEEAQGGGATAAPVSEDELAAALRDTRRSSLVLWGLLVLALVAGGIAWAWTGVSVAMALAIVLGVLCLLELLRLVVERDPDRHEARSLEVYETTEAATGAPDDLLRQAYQQVGRLLAALPLTVVGIVLVRAATGPVILSFHGGYNRGAAFQLLVYGLVGIVVGCLALPAAFRRVDTEDTPNSWEWKYVALAGATAVAVGVLIGFPLVVPEWAGSLAVVAVAVSALCVVFAELERLTELTSPPSGLVMLGFRRVPVFTLLAAWFAVATLLDTTGRHEIRVDGEDPPQEVVLGNLWDDWMRRNCADTRQQPVPLAFVIAHGGGIRAAYWTGSVLTDLMEEPAPGSAPADSDDLDVPQEGEEPPCGGSSVRSHVFAVSSISGGSVGTAAYLSQTDPDDTWYTTALGDPDYSAVALSRGLLVDLPRTLVGFNVDDRAGLLERAWEDNVDGMEKDYFTHLLPGMRPADEGSWMPLTLFNSAQAETGCRVNVSAIRLTSRALQDLGDCRATVGRYNTVPPAVPSGPRVQAAPVTVDAIAKTKACDESFSVSTAALMSARWPYISPSGRFPCGDPGVSTIDGGYADPAGYAGFMELWAQLAPLVEKHNEAVDPDVGNYIVPVLVVVDNHYQSTATAAEAARTPELLVPPLGAFRASGTRGPDREQEAISMVGVAPPGAPGQCDVPAYWPDGGTESIGRALLAPTTRPGLPAPLAWTLAASSRSDLDDQRENLFDPDQVGARLRDTLSGGSEYAITCEGPAKEKPPRGGG